MGLNENNFKSSAERIRRGNMAAAPVLPYSSASELADEVKKYIIGQDRAVEALSVSFFQHLCEKYRGVTCPTKTATLLCGSTGCGKSETLRVFAEKCGFPVVRVNSADIVPSAWKGTHLSDYFGDALNRHTADELKSAVVIFHEFDKIIHAGAKVGTSGEDIDADMQRDVMRLFERSHSLRIPKGFDSRTMDQVAVDLPTDGMLLVFDGAFSEIGQIVRRRLNLTGRIGFGATPPQVVETTGFGGDIIGEDLVRFGFMPELVGRISDILTLRSLDEETIYRIMTTARDGIVESESRYVRAIYNADLRFSDDALRLISKEASRLGLGFRSVRALLARCLNTIYYNMKIDGGETRVISVDRDFVVKQLGK